MNEIITHAPLCEKCGKHHNATAFLTCRIGELEQQLADAKAECGDWKNAAEAEAVYVNELQQQLAAVKEEIAKIKGVLANVPILNFLRQHRSKLFQLQGCHDGAMSEDCKQLFRDDYTTLDALVRELEIA